jgi:hypothetical protein
MVPVLSKKVQVTYLRVIMSLVKPIENIKVRGGGERGGGAMRVVMSNQDHKDFRGNSNSTDSSFRKKRSEREKESELRNEKCKENV